MLEHRNKIDAFNSIMSHPKLSKIIGAAFDAPIGSTKRKQALSIINSIDKIYDRKFREDGQGGPTTVTPKWGQSAPTKTNYLPYTPQTNTPYSKLTVLPPAPPMINIDQSGSVVRTPGMDLYEQGQKNLQNPQQNIQNGSLSTTGSTSYTGAPLLNLNKPIQQKSDFEIQAELLGKQNKSIENRPREPFPPLNKSYDSSQFAKNVTNINQSKQQVVQKPVTQKYGITTEEIKGISIQQEGANELYNGLISAGIDSKTAVNVVKQNYNGLSPTTHEETEQKTTTPINDIEKIAMESPGEEVFKSNIRSLPIEELRKMFPGTSDEYLPIGASLSRQLDALSETLKKEKGLKYWEEKSIEQAKLGKTIIPDTQKYIRERDEYISGIDKMINDTEHKLIDTFNPDDIKHLNDYVDYLNTLKGRQNQSYTAFLNANIEAYNRESDRINYEYTKARDDYNETFQRKSTIKTEDYNNWSKKLDEKWKQIHDANDKEKILDWEIKLDNYNKSQLNTIKSIIDLNNNNSNFISEQKDYSDRFVDKDSILHPSVNIPYEVDLLIDNGKKQAGIIDQIGRGLSVTMDKHKSNIPQLYKELKLRSNQLFNLSGSKKLQNAKGVSQQLTSGMYDVADPYIKNYLSENKDKFIEALKDITPGSFGRGQMDKESWIKKYKDSIDSSLLGDIYDNYQTAKVIDFGDDPENARGVFTGDDGNGHIIKTIDNSNIENVINNVVYVIKYYNLKRLGYDPSLIK